MFFICRQTVQVQRRGNIDLLVVDTQGANLTVQPEDRRQERELCERRSQLVLVQAYLMTHP